MGYSYWPDPGEDYLFSEGLVKLVHVIAKKVGLHSGQQLLDVGCGTGGPSLIYAVDYGAVVTGIATSREHIEKAAVNAANSTLSNQVRFQLVDATKMPFTTGTFDVALANGVMVHISDRTEAIAEIFRVLRPGGRFAFCDLARREKLTEGQDKKLRRVLRKGLFTPTEYIEAGRKAGFKIEESLDCTPNSYQTFTKWLQRFEEYQASPAGQRHSVAIFETLKREVEKWISMEEDIISYVIIVMRKPSRKT
jgi:cyclopropane fatty-acyl-phospholipid synthase-like methyltransferase